MHFENRTACPRERVLRSRDIPVHFQTLRGHAASQVRIQSHEQTRFKAQKYVFMSPENNIFSFCNLLMPAWSSV